MNLTDLEEQCNKSVYFDASLFSNWLNVSKFNSTSELTVYICEYKKYQKFNDSSNRYMGWIYLFFGIFGFVSSLLSLAVLWNNSNFNAVSFIYFRFIAWLEIVHAVNVLIHGLKFLFYDTYIHTFGWIWLYLICLRLSNMCSRTVDYLVVFLSIERAAACLAPNIFKSINRRPVALGICMGMSCFSILLASPGYFSSKVVQDPKRGIYSSTLSDFGKSAFYKGINHLLDAVRFFVTGCVIVTTGLVIAGMMKSIKRKKHLKQVHPAPGQNQPGNGNSQHANSSNNISKQSLQLCYLQISQALPTALNYILLTISNTLFPSLTVGYLAITGEMGFTLSMQNLKSAYIDDWLLIFIKLTDNIAHCFHFYLYYLFSRRFRDGAVERFKRKQTPVIKSNNANTTGKCDTQLVPVEN